MRKSFLLLLFCLFFLSGCSEKNAQKVVHFGLSTDLQSLDVSQLSDGSSIYIADSVQEGLTRIDSKNQAQPALASSITASQDGLTYNIKLRPHLKWSNGDNLTAPDFIASWKRTLVFQPLVELKSYKAVSKDKIEIKLNHADPYFKYVLSMTNMMPINQKMLAKYGKQYGTTSEKTAYIGPFMFSKSQPWTGTNNQFSLVKNPNYWDKSAVKSSEISFQRINNTETGVQLFKEGKLDYTELDSPELAAAYKKTASYTIFPESGTVFFRYNASGKVPATANTNIRKALNLATNRQALIGLAAPTASLAKSFLPAGVATDKNGNDFSKDAVQDYHYNPTEAKELWLKGLKELHLSQVNLTLEASGDKSSRKAMITYLQTAWQELLPGLTITLKSPSSEETMADIHNKNYDIVLDSWFAGYPDPSTFYQIFDSSNLFNSFKSKAYDATIKAATVAKTPQERDSAYLNCESILYQQALINPIYCPSTVALVNPRLTGFDYYSTIGWNIKGIYLK